MESDWFAPVIIEKDFTVHVRGRNFKCKSLNDAYLTAAEQLVLLEIQTRIDALDKLEPQKSTFGQFVLNRSMGE